MGYYDPKNYITFQSGTMHRRYINQSGKITNRTFCGEDTYNRPTIFNVDHERRCKKCEGTGKGNMGYKP